MLPVEHPLNKTMTHQTISNQANNKSANNLARHQRFGASSLARMRHSKGFTLVELEPLASHPGTALQRQGLQRQAAQHQHQ